MQREPDPAHLGLCRTATSDFRTLQLAAEAITDLWSFDFFSSYNSLCYYSTHINGVYSITDHNGMNTQIRSHFKALHHNLVVL